MDYKLNSSKEYNLENNKNDGWKQSLEAKLKSLDHITLIISLLLNIFGLIVLYSATMATSDGIFGTGTLVRQLIFSGISIIVMIVLAILPNDLFKNRNLIFIGMIVICLLLIFTYIHGEAQGGAVSWIKIFGINFQASEFLKVLIVLSQALILTKNKNDNSNYYRYLKALVIISLVLVFIQPDFGMLLLNLINMVIVYMVYKHSPKNNVIFYAIIIVLYVAAYFFSSVFNDQLANSGIHILERLAIFVDPLKDSKGLGYQHSLAFQAIANGGLFGVGLGNGIIKKIGLPAGETDFIIVIIAEEFGIIAAIIVIVLELAIGFRMILWANKENNRYNSIVATGIGLIYILQTVVNVCGALNLIPMTGVTLPFISKGGSSLLALYIALGIYQNFVINSKEKNYTKHNKRRDG